MMMEVRRRLKERKRRKRRKKKKKKKTKKKKKKKKKNDDVIYKNFCMSTLTKQYGRSVTVGVHLKTPFIALLLNK